MSAILEKSPVRRASANDAPPAYPVPLLTWQDVPTSTLQGYAPDPSLPMGQYAVACVMQWAQAQGYPGAIPTWEVGPGVWGVIVFQPNAALTQVSIPISELGGFDAGNTILWSQLVMAWATGYGYQLGIPTFQTDGVNVTALLFGADYPGISFYDAPNAQLYQALRQPGKLCNLQDPAVWANAAMRVGMNLGYGAAWPTWQWTTNRGLMCISALDYGPLPDASDANVANVLKVLSNTVTMLQNSTADALAEFSGVYDAFEAAPVTDTGLKILTDILFGALQIGLGMIPGVGGVISGIVSTAVTVAQDAASAKGGTSGNYTLLQYQEMLLAASDATVNYVSTAHDTLMDSQGNGTLAQVWAQPYNDPLSGRASQLGMLALASNDVVNGLEFWTTLGEQVTQGLVTNLMGSITAQLYGIQYRTYANAPVGKQFFYGSIADVTAPDGKMAQYITSESDGSDLPVLFTDFVQEPGHARGEYVTATEWWLQAPGQSTLPEYPPPSLTYNLFSSDGFGNTVNWNGPFSKATVYSTWFLPLLQIGSEGFLQNWAYFAGNGYLVSATVQQIGGASAVAGYTDAWGNLYSDASNPVVLQSGFTQPVIVNYLAPLN
jgi:hypothetical protein